MLWWTGLVDTNVPLKCSLQLNTQKIEFTKKFSKTLEFYAFFLLVGWSPAFANFIFESRICLPADFQKKIVDIQENIQQIEKITILEVLVRLDSFCCKQPRTRGRQRYSKNVTALYIIPFGLFSERNFKKQ